MADPSPTKAAPTKAAPTKAAPTKAALDKGKEQLDKATRKASDNATGRKTYVMPLRVAYIASFSAPLDTGQPGEPFELWSSSDVQQVLAVASAVMRQCFQIKLLWERPRPIMLTESTDPRYPNFGLPKVEGLGGAAIFEAQHDVYDAFLKRVTPAFPKSEWDQETYALLVNKIYDRKVQAEVDNPAVSTTLGYALPADDGSDRQSNRVVLKYEGDAARPRKVGSLTRWIPSSHVHVDRAGLVLAHELGHALECEHDDLAVGAKANLMAKNVENPAPGAAPLRPSADYDVDPAVAEEARQYGKDVGLLRE